MASLYENTKLLVHFDGTDGATTSTDESASGHSLTFAGTAQLDTAQKKFGTASVLLDGNSDYVSAPDSDDWNFGSGEFTLESFIKPSGDLANGSYAIILSQWLSTGNQRSWYMMLLKDSGKYYLVFTYSTTGSDKNKLQIELSGFDYTDWNFVTFEREVNTGRLYLNGIQIGTIDMTGHTLYNATAKCVIGALDSAGVEYFDGWIDDTRITKGEALYSGNFPVPTSPLVAGSLIGRSFEIDYDNGWIVNNDNVLLYEIYNAVNNSLNILYDNGFLVNINQGFIYNIQNAIKNNIAIKYGIGVNVNNSLVIEYLIANAINNVLNIKYDNGYIINNDCECSYDLSAYINNSLRCQYAIKQEVSNDLNAKYRIGSLINNDLNFIYKIDFYKDLNVNYNIGNIVNNDSQFVYNIRFSSDLNILNDIGFLVNSDFNNKYDIPLSHLGNNLQFKYLSQINVHRDIRTLDDLYNQILNDLIVKYNINSQVINDLVVKYDIDSHALIAVINDLVIRYNIAKEYDARLNLDLSDKNKINIILD